MSNELVPIDQARGPQAMAIRRQQQVATNKNFSDGVRDAFPLLSIKGKVFRVRIGGVETAFVDPTTKQAVPALDVVLVNASRNLSKSYYIKGYTEGQLDAPDCWSMDSLRPDPSVANKVSISCVSCPMNAFGSKITEAGKQAKACQDARRIAVVMPHQLGQPEPLVMLLRVPATSLKNLKAYAQLLDRHGFEPNGCVTRIHFDYVDAFPKLVFNFVTALTDAQYERTIEMAEGQTVQGMLQAPDFDGAPSVSPKPNENVGGLVAQQGPVLEDPTIVQPVGPVLETQVQTPATGMAATLQETAAQQHPVQSVVPSNDPTIIDLPDGRKFDTKTGQFVEAVVAPVVEMDPTTIALPNGQFFNQGLKAFVTGPEKGAKPVENVVPPATGDKPKRARGPNKPKEPVATATPASAQQAPAAVAPELGQPEPAVNGTPTTDAAAQAQAAALVAGAVNGAPVTEPPVQQGTSDATIAAAPPNLEALLKGLVGAATT
jgi:hypothetical protein